MNRATRILVRVSVVPLVVGSMSVALLSGLAYSDRLDYQKRTVASVETTTITDGPARQQAAKRNIADADIAGLKSLTTLAVALDIDPLGKSFTDTALSGSVRGDIKDASKAYKKSLASRALTSIIGDDLTNIEQWCADPATPPRSSFLQGTGLLLRGFTPEQASKERAFRVAYAQHFKVLTDRSAAICPTFTDA